MKFFTSIVSFLIEGILIILAIVWHLKNPNEEEPVITLVTFCAAPIIGVVTYFASIQKRPNIDFHHTLNNLGRYTKGITQNNPSVIEVGITPVENYWDLVWNYHLEVRNNSSVDAHKIKMEYIDIPPQTKVYGEVGVIEPILANERLEMRFEIRKHFVGTSKAADVELKNNPDTFLNAFKIKALYVDEHQTKFSSSYHWITKKIIYEKDKMPDYIRTAIAIVGLIILLWGLYNYSQSSSKIIKSPIGTKVSNKSIVTKPESKKIQQEKPILNSEIKKTSLNSSQIFSRKTPKQDSVVKPLINVKADGGSIATYGQIGNNQIIKNYDKPEAKIETISSTINEKITTLSLRVEDWKNSKLPNDKYNYPYLFKSTITVKYSAPQILNGFGFLSSRTDVVLMEIKHIGVTNISSGNYYGKKYIVATQPENGTYTFEAYTPKEISGIEEVFVLLK